MNQPDWDIEKRGMMQEIIRLQRELEQARIKAKNAEDYAATAITMAAEKGIKITSTDLIERSNKMKEGQ